MDQSIITINLRNIIGASIREDIRDVKQQNSTRLQRAC